ncbi:GTP-binding protein [Geomonas subterranea]|uniref:Adenylyl-sulfate kinase n=1 Tax=Geomonas subterranea TaxID=2847989 RepID=A0ABX8LJ37_9BACT|nr:MULTISPECIES: GTP-binding protein [Geomonas]QXE90916.1 adenylyl-sulfate kinase [Geomonas subterranea]QXM10998.1 adenylyl-sulfate kinase [Geomonas subterranea]
MDTAKEHFQIVFVGHVDHGKSTLLGRLYADTDSLPVGHLDKVRDICARQGKVFEYAFLFDAFLEEQEQGITIDTARTFFSWGDRQYIIIDAPGHKEFLKNMISGAARAEAAVLIIDAGEGIQEQSKRHGYLLSLLGIRQVVVVVNKMDLVGYSEEAFRAIEKEYRAFLSHLKLEPQYFIPASARNGDNVAARSGAMPWYGGLTLLESLANFVKLPARTDLPLRIPVQDIYKFDPRRIIAGRVEAGQFSVGDTLVFSPSNKTAVVKSIEAFNVPNVVHSVPAGRSAGFTLDEQIFVERGEVASHKDAAPEVSDRFKANIFWMGKNPVPVGGRYLLRIATAEVEMEVEAILGIIDASTLGRGESPERIEKNDVAEVIIRTRRPIALDRYADIDTTGRFVIIEGYDIQGGGIVMEVFKDEQEPFRAEARRRDFEWRRGEIHLDERVLRNGHYPGIVLFTGEKGSGKARLARHLERRLFNGGKQVYLLDGKNLQYGLGTDLSDSDKEEMVRRFGEVAQILLRAGQIVVSTTNTFALADHQIIRALVHPHTVIAVHMSFVEGPLPDNTDLHFLESDDLKAAAKTIMELMEEKNILL